MNFPFFIRGLDVERLVLPGDSYLHSLDPRVKILAAVTSIAGLVAMTHITTPLLVFLFSAVVTLSIGMPFLTFIYRTGSIGVVAVVVSVVAVFFHGGTEIIFRLWGLPIYREALVYAFALFVRVLAAIAVLQLFAAVTPIIDLLSALTWFRVPQILINLTAMILRFLRLLSLEAVRFYYALASRGGFSQRLSYRQQMDNLGMVAGALFLRAFNRSEKAYRAMIARGFTTDSTFASPANPISHSDCVVCGVVIVVMTSLLIADYSGVVLL